MKQARYNIFEGKLSKRGKGMNTLGVEQVVGYKIFAHGVVENEGVEVGLVVSPTKEGQSDALVGLKKMRKNLKNAEQVVIIVLEIKQSDRGLSHSLVSKYSLVSHKVVGDKKSNYSTMYADSNNQTFVEHKLKLKEVFKLVERELVSTIEQVRLLNGQVRLLKDIFGIE